MKSLSEYIMNITESMKVVDKAKVTQRNKDMKKLISTQDPGDIILSLDNAPLFLAWVFQQYGLTYDIDVLEQDFPRDDDRFYSSLIKRYGTNLYFNEESKTFRGKIWNLPNYDQDKLTSNLLGKTWVEAFQFLQDRKLIQGKPAKIVVSSEEAKKMIIDYCESKIYYDGWYFNNIHNPDFKYSLHGLLKDDCKKLMGYCKDNHVKCKMILAGSKAYGILMF